MKKPKKKIDLRTFIKKCTLYYTYLGLAVGVVFLFVCIFNKNFSFNVNDVPYYGVTGGLIALVAWPIIGAIVGFFHSFLWYTHLWIFRKNHQ
jgi:hypothetical protein